MEPEEILEILFMTVLMFIFVLGIPYFLVILFVSLGLV